MPIVPGVDGAATPRTACTLSPKTAGTRAPRCLEAAELDVTVNGIEVTEADLEAVFLHLTGTALRD